MIKKFLSIKNNQKFIFFFGVLGFSVVGFVILVLTAVIISIAHINTVGNSSLYLVILAVMITIISIAFVLDKKDEKDMRNDKIILLSIFYVLFAIFGSKILLFSRSSIVLKEIINIVKNFFLVTPAMALLFSKLKGKNDGQNRINKNECNNKFKRININGEKISKNLLRWIIFLLLLLLIYAYFVTDIIPQKRSVQPLNNLIVCVYMALGGYIWANTKIEKYNLFYCILQTIQVFAVGALALLFDFQIQK